MRIHSTCQEVLLGFLVVVLLFSGSNLFCYGSTSDKTIEVVGVAECADCKDSNIKTSHAVSGLRVTVDCKHESGEFQTRGVGELDKEGNFKVSLPHEIVKDGKLQEECYAQLHSASLAPCASHNGIEASKITFRSKTDSKHTFGPTGKLKFSSAVCTSAFLWPYYKYPPLPTLPPFPKKHPWFKNFGHPFPLTPISFPPLPIYKKPCPPPIPFVKPTPPVVTTPTPVYKPKPNPPVYKPAPVPVYKPKPKPPVYKPAPVPVYKPKPKPPVYKPAPVPVYKPKPKPPVYKPTPVPVYAKPKPPVYKPKPKPLPPSIPIYKPLPPISKPLPPPIPIYKPLPPIPKIPPFYKKPCPPFTPLPSLPPFTLPPKISPHPKYGFPPLPPHIPHP